MGSQFMGPSQMGYMMRNPAMYRQASAIREAQYGGSRAGEQGAQALAKALQLNRSRAKGVSTFGLPSMRK